MVYDQDTLRFAAAWTGQGFIDWNGINFNGQHQVHPRIAGKLEFANSNVAAWANPEDGTWADLRERGRDGRPYGPLPRSLVHYRGLYRHGDRLVLSYTVGQAEILEAPGLEADLAGKDGPVFTRTLNIGRSPHDLETIVAPAGTAVTLQSGSGRDRVQLVEHEHSVRLRVPAAATPVELKLLMRRGAPGSLDEFARKSPSPESLASLTRGGPTRWPERLPTRPTIGRDDGPFAVDILSVPDANPWLCQLRLSGFDFLPDGRTAAVCTWDGDVWIVEGVDRPEKGLTWRRIASGLFQPLGLKIVEGEIYVCCRDQIVRLHDLNGDGETDFYECFNNDHQVTEHFHEFAMDLQTDAEGNFYYAKAARHALPALVPHHGTLLKVSKDGGAHRDPRHRLPRPQRRLPQPRRHVLRDRSGRILDCRRTASTG